MAVKNGIWTFVLKVVIQILKAVLSALSTKKRCDTNSGNVEYKQDEQENVDTKKKVNELIKKKLADGKEEK